jgi:uracil-DNA glycosylase
MIEACSVYRVATLQQLRPKTIVAMGSVACEAFIGEQKVGNFEGTCWIPNEPFVREFVERVWITYSPAYALEDPSNAVSIYRTLYQAAEEAGLNPKFNKEAKAFDYGT